MDIKKKLKYIKDKLSLIIICFLFFFYYLEVLDYGLPYFENFDETTHIKSINYFFGFFTYANQQIHEPIYAPFIHFILSGTFIFIKYIFFGNFNFSETVNLIYLNPNILFENVRLSSLLISTGSLVIFFSILKKLEINNLLITLSLISVSLSYLFMDISIVAGKNSVLLFIFLLQYYLFLIYYLNIEKLNLKSYFLFGFITSIAWGVNYWAATPGLYAVFLLHYKKFRLTQLKNLFSFFLIFLIFGIIFNFVVSSDNFLDHIFSPEYIKDYIPSGLRGLMLAGALSAAMSSLSSSINSLASSTIIDIFGESVNVKKSIIVSIIWGIVLTGFCLMFDYDPESSIVILCLKIVSFTYGGLISLFLFARLNISFLKESIMFGYIGSIAILLVLAYYNIGWEYYIVISILSNFIITNYVNFYYSLLRRK